MTPVSVSGTAILSISSVARQWSPWRTRSPASSSEPGQTIWTENSYKFTRDSASIMLADAGFEIDQWHTDEDEMFAVILATPVV